MARWGQQVPRHLRRGHVLGGWSQRAHLCLPMRYTEALVLRAQSRWLYEKSHRCTSGQTWDCPLPFLMSLSVRGVLGVGGGVLCSQRPASQPHPSTHYSPQKYSSWPKSALLTLLCHSSLTPVPDPTHSTPNTAASRPSRVENTVFQAKRLPSSSDQQQGLARVH